MPPASNTGDQLALSQGLAEVSQGEAAGKFPGDTSALVLTHQGFEDT